jgi:cold shock CspA family protein
MSKSSTVTPDAVEPVDAQVDQTDQEHHIVVVQEEHEEDTAPLVVQEVPESYTVGEYIGQCKWFSDKIGYGFVTIQNGEHKGKDIFVHYSGIKPLNSNYKTLKKGEYISLDIITGNHGLQAVNIRGILGGSLQCDVLPQSSRAPTPVTENIGRVVHYRNKRYGTGAPPGPPSTPYKNSI